MFDLLISAGRVFCPLTGLDGPGAVAVRDGRIAAAGAGVSGPARRHLDFPDGLLLPGLVDLHAHPGLPESKFAVDPDAAILPYGTTTVMAQGEAGADNLERYLDEVVAPSRTRVLLALNLAAPGETRPRGCFEHLDDADVERCVRAARSAGAAVWGLSVNTSVPSCGGTDPREVLRRALEAAHSTGLPLLVGTRRAPDWSLDDQLPRLRAGDVVTYCFHGGPEGLLEDAGKVRPCVREARLRGVLFDVGHGFGSFAFSVAGACLAQGFPPDTVSTDLYRRHLGQHPVHHLPAVVSKLVAAGMPEADAWSAATRAPARVLGLEAEAGALGVGRPADLCVVRPGEAPLRDTAGETRPGKRWEPVLTVRAGNPGPAPGPGEPPDSPQGMRV